MHIQLPKQVLPKQGLRKTKWKRHHMRELEAFDAKEAGSVFVGPAIAILLLAPLSVQPRARLHVRHVLHCILAHVRHLKVDLRVIHTHTPFSKLQQHNLQQPNLQ